MSVNEVKLTAAVEELVIRGTGPATSRTFVIGNEDHTLGNVLRHTLLASDQTVEFAGYSVPHPSEPVVHIRVQTEPGSITTASNRSQSEMADDDEEVERPNTASEAVTRACHTVYRQCDIVLERLEKMLPEVKEDRLRIEEIRRKEEEDEEGDEEEEGEEGDEEEEGEDLMEE